MTEVHFTVFMNMFSGEHCIQINRVGEGKVFLQWPLKAQGNIALG